MDVHLDARSINAEVKRVLGHKATSVTQSPDLRKDIGQAYVEQVSPYVPKKTGKLRESGRGTDDGRVYWTATSPKGYNYANIQYTNIQFNHHFPETAHWTEYVQPGTPDWDEFRDRITPMIKRRFRDEQR